jgi:CelD/BcsL family acetyltransferase involved in cellulose biosynthesis
VIALDPLQDPRWGAFVDAHPRASVFHTAGWLAALRRTYGYQPLALATESGDGALSGAILLCDVDSWLTGHRLVGLPFSDHCNPLVDSPAALAPLLAAARGRLREGGLRYLELRSTEPADGELGFDATYTYCLHRVDLRPSLDDLFHGCHRSCTQHKIRRAMRRKLRHEEGRSPELLDDFYRLLVLTRRRHRIPPQPRAWFANLIDACGEALSIRVAYQDATPIASILTLRHQRTLYYKYGCSNGEFRSLGGPQFLLWRALADAKHAGLESFDLGRSEWKNPGLIQFKDRWGAERSILSYLRLCDDVERNGFGVPGGDWRAQAVRWLSPRLPDPLFRAAGRLLYRHIG